MAERPPVYGGESAACHSALGPQLMPVSLIARSASELVSALCSWIVYVQLHAER